MYNNIDMIIKKRTLKMMLILFFLLAVAIMLILVSINSHKTRDTLTKDLKTYFDAISGYDAEITKIEKSGDEYNVSVKIDNRLYVYLLEPDKIRSWLVSLELFKNCLDEKNIKIFIENNQYSKKQLTLLPLLGKDATKYIVKCDINSQVCNKIGINSLPAVLYYGYVYPGPKTGRQFFGLTGCEPANYARVIHHPNLPITIGY